MNFINFSVSKGWSKDNEFCLGCDSTDRQHYAHGLCSNCYKTARYWFKNNDSFDWPTSKENIQHFVDVNKEYLSRLRIKQPFIHKEETEIE